MSGKGYVYKRCGCTVVENGRRRQLGKSCPKLKRPDGAWNPRHGTWTFAISVAGERGTRKQVVRGGYDSQREAQAGMDELRERPAAASTSRERLTVGQYLAERVAGKTDMKANTAASYRRHIDLYFDPLIGHIRLADLRVQHVADMLAQVALVKGARGGGPATRQRVRASLRTALTDAVRQGLITVNPAALVKLETGRRPKALVWTDDRVERWQAEVDKLAKSRLNRITATGMRDLRYNTTASPSERALLCPHPAPSWSGDRVSSGGFLTTPPTIVCTRSGTCTRSADCVAARHGT
jgi:hypothetical protein